MCVCACALEVVKRGRKILSYKKERRKKYCMYWVTVNGRIELNSFMK